MKLTYPNQLVCYQIYIYCMSLQIREIIISLLINTVVSKCKYGKVIPVLN
jgi:hypothetical protein